MTGEILSTPDDKDESAQVILGSMTVARNYRKLYQEKVQELSEYAQTLEDTHMSITGILRSRGGATMNRDDPRAQVTNLQVLIAAAGAYNFEAYVQPEHLPCIEIVAFTVEDNELVTGFLSEGWLSAVQVPLEELAPTQ
jgi:hypothetical protein